MRSALDDLMSGVKDGLNAKNKDNFTRNLYTFSQAPARGAAWRERLELIAESLAK